MTLGDREPMDSRASEPDGKYREPEMACFDWQMAGHAIDESGQSVLPAPLYECLTRLYPDAARETNRAGFRWCEFPARQAAIDALGAAALWLGRKRAGLGHLNRPR